MPSDENDVSLENDGSWKPVPKVDDKPAKTGNSSSALPASKKAEENDVDLIDLSDDDDEAPVPASDNRPPPPPPPMPVAAPPPPPPAEIECIDLD